MLPSGTLATHTLSSQSPAKPATAGPPARSLHQFKPAAAAGFALHSQPQVKPAAAAGSVPPPLAQFARRSRVAAGAGTGITARAGRFFFRESHNRLSFAVEAAVFSTPATELARHPLYLTLAGYRARHAQLHSLQWRKPATARLSYVLASAA